MIGMVSSQGLVGRSTRFDRVISRFTRLVRRGFNQSRLFRRALVFLFWPRVRRRALDLSHLPWYQEQDANGPVQREEALLLYALVRVLRPAVVVDIGFSRGRSALNFLLAMPASSRLYSFDNTDVGESLAASDFRHYPNFTFKRKSQDEISAADVGCLPVDLVLLDASHDLGTNIRTFEALERLLADHAVLVVHDTGVWARNCFGPVQEEIARGHGDNWVSADQYQHRPQEREFVNWIRENHDEFGRLHLESTRTLRHGMTIFQRQRVLQTTPGRPFHALAGQAAREESRG